METTEEFTPPQPSQAIDTDWYVRPYKESDEDAVLALYEKAFKRPRDRSHRLWKLHGRRAPFNLLWVAAVPPTQGETGEQIVGHYGGIPIHLKIGDRLHAAVHAVEAMTDPQYRRQGMLTRLGGTAHSTWEAAGQWAVTGLPNDQWGTRNRALGYLSLFPLSWLRFPLHLDRSLVRRANVPKVLRKAGRLPLMAASAAWTAATRLRNGSASKTIQVDNATAGEGIFDEIWAYASSGWTNIQMRDDTWVRWRFLEAAPNPYHVAVAHSNNGKPLGYVAYRVVEQGEHRNGYLADLFVARNDRAAAWALINQALHQLSLEGAGSVMTLAPPGSALYDLYHKLGFLRTRAETAFSFELVPLDPTISVDALSNPRHWYLSGGDFDVI